MPEQYYTLAPWRVREGKQDEFVEAWRDLGEVFLALPKPPGKGTLLQSVDDPQQFYSFGPWNALEDIAEMRSNQRAAEALERLRDLCESAKPGAFRLVLTLGE